jgi:uncharacterized protein YyaL (SSP411 family)
MKDALKLQMEMSERFWNKEQGGFFLTDSNDSRLLFRFEQDADGVSPSSNALGADNLLKLSFLTDNHELFGQAQKIFEHNSAQFASSPLNFPYLAVSLANWYGMRKIVVVNPGPEYLLLRERLKRSYHPLAIMTAGTDSPDSKERFFVCTRESCLPAVESAEEVIHLLR